MHHVLAYLDLRPMGTPVAGPTMVESPDNNNSKKDCGNGYE